MMTVTRLRRNKIFDKFTGKTTLSSWTAAEELEIANVLLAPGHPLEQRTVSAVTAPEVHTLYAVGFEPDILKEDRIRFRNRIFAVVQSPNVWIDPWPLEGQDDTVGVTVVLEEVL